MIRSKKEGSRRHRVAAAGLIAAAATMAFGAASASAVSKDLSVPFDDAALTLPVTGTSDVLEPPNTASIGGTGVIDGTTGNITGAGMTFPDFTGTASGVPVKVSFDNNSPFNGTLDLVTGAMNFPSANYTAVVQLSPPTGVICTYNPVPLVFTTTGGSPIAGVPFTVANGTAVSTTHGILTANWTSSTFPAAVASNPPGGDCGLVNSIVHGGNGQLALGNGFDLTPPAPPADTGGGGTVAPPVKKKCKKAKKGSAQSAKKKGCKKKKK
jgi:hypothetical protein